MSAPDAVAKTGAIAGRVLRQIRGNRRFSVAMLVIPIAILFLLKVVFDALGVPAPAQRRFAVLGVAYLIHFVAFLLTALVVVGERVQGTLGRMFIAGYRRGEIVAGYLVSYTVFATIQGIVVLAVAYGLFDLGYDAGELAQIFVVVWLLAVFMMALGILVSSTARNEVQVIPFVPAILVPALFLSGMVVDVDRLPIWAQVLARFTPLYYAVEVFAGFFSAGSIVSDVGSFLLLPALALVVFGLATATLREER